MKRSFGDMRVPKCNLRNETGIYSADKKPLGANAERATRNAARGGPAENGSTLAEKLVTPDEKRASRNANPVRTDAKCISHDTKPPILKEKRATSDAPHAR